MRNYQKGQADSWDSEVRRIYWAENAPQKWLLLEKQMLMPIQAIAAWGWLKKKSGNQHWWKSMQTYGGLVTSEWQVNVAACRVSEKLGNRAVVVHCPGAHWMSAPSHQMIIIQTSGHGKKREEIFCLESADMWGRTLLYRSLKTVTK